MSTEESNDVSPSEAPTPPNAPEPQNTPAPTLQALRVEFSQRLNRLREDFTRQHEELEDDLVAVQDAMRKRERYGHSLEAMLGRLSDALSMHGAAIEKIDETTQAILEELHFKEKTAAVLEALREPQP